MCFFVLEAFFVFFLFFQANLIERQLPGRPPKTMFEGFTTLSKYPSCKCEKQFPLPKLSFCYGPCILYTRNDSLRKYLNHGLLEHFHEIKTLSVLLKTVISSLLLLLLTISLFTEISITVSRQLVPIILMRNITCCSILMYGGRRTYNFEKRLFSYKLYSSFIIPPVCPFAVSFVAEYWEALE